MYTFKRDFEVQKAERFFKERGVKVQAVDMKKHAPGLKELTLFAQRAGLQTIIDREGKAYRQSTVRFLSGEQAILQALAQDPSLLKVPIVRMGQKVTVGYRPDIWKTWLET